MKSNTRRIGSTDYVINNYICSNEVEFCKISDYQGTMGKGVQYKSVEDGINSILRKDLKGYKRHVFTMEEAIQKYQAEEFAWNLRLWEYIHSSNGELKKTGFIVIISKEDIYDKEAQVYGKVAYCRSAKAKDEMQIGNKMLMKVIDTSDYTQSQMFHLNHGMSEERYMST